MPWFLTAYPSFTKLPRVPDAGTYGADLWARNHRHAVEVAEQRGFGERIISGPSRKPTTHKLVSAQIEAHAPWDAVLHNAIFMGWVALRCRVATVDEILGDGGLVHEIMHARVGVTGPGYRKRLASHARAIEALIPGWTAPNRRRAA